MPDNQFIYDLPRSLFAEQKGMITRIFNYLQNETEMTVAIPLNALIVKLKQIIPARYLKVDKVEDSAEIDVDSILSLAMNKTLLKMNESYIDKQKLDASEAKAITNALHKIVYDLRDGGVSTGLHKYLMEEIKDLSFDCYREKYQNIFEYLFKVLKKAIAVQLENSSSFSEI